MTRFQYLTESVRESSSKLRNQRYTFHRGAVNWPIYDFKASECLWTLYLSGIIPKPTGFISCTATFEIACRFDNALLDDLLLDELITDVCQVYEDLTRAKLPNGDCLVVKAELPVINEFFDANSRVQGISATFPLDL